MQILDNNLIEELSTKAKQSPRLRMNYNLHTTLDAKAQRLFNALEKGTILPIHRHKDTDETYIVIKGILKVQCFDNDKNITDEIIIDPQNGVFGGHIPKGTFHTVEVVEPTILFEVKDGPYTPITDEDILS